MGAIRFLLALCVALNHAKLIYEIPVGGVTLTAIDNVAAVQSFFVLSGFYMQKAYSRYYSGSPASFIISRYARLWPGYMITLVVTFTFYLLLLAIPGASPVGDPFGAFQFFHSDMAGDPVFLLAAVLLPLQDILSVNYAVHMQLPVRASWSIAAELAFYLMVPFLVRVSRGGLLLLMSTAFSIKFLVLLLYGELASYFPFYTNVGFFVAGFLVSRYAPSQVRFGHVPLLALGILILTFGGAGFESAPMKNAVLVLAVCAAISSVDLGKEGKISAALGSGAYLLYLSHIPVLAFFTALFGDELAPKIAAISVAVLASLLIERIFLAPLDRRRRQRFWVKQAA